MQTLLRILAPDKTLVDEPVDFIRLEALNGSLGILPQHAPMAAQLKKSKVLYYVGDKEESVDIDGGFAKVMPSEVVVFVT
jgi:F-type H+-transporting ATPase subunit epsilon